MEVAHGNHGRGPDGLPARSTEHHGPASARAKAFALRLCDRGNLGLLVGSEQAGALTTRMSSSYAPRDP